MLVSHKHKFVFVHIYKNAGRSITEALLPYASSHLNYLLSRAFKKLHLPYPSSPRPLDDHVTAADIINYLGSDLYDEYFSFAFVRNPWSWQVSMYEFMKKRQDHFQHDLSLRFRNFEEYVEWRCMNDVHYQKDFVYSENNEKLVSYIGKFESLEQDFKYVCDVIGIDASLKKTNVSAIKPYQEYYNSQTKDMIYKTFKVDIDLFQYEFE